MAALTAREHKDDAAIRLAQSALAEARYQAERAEAQFDAVEPANQNVFHNLARKWEACLSRVRDCEARLQALEASKDRQQELTPDERDAYLALGEDLQRLWSHERMPPQLRKRLLRAVLVEIIATIKGREIHLLLHWKGGDHSHLVVPRNRIGVHRWTTDVQTGALIRDLARMLKVTCVGDTLTSLFPVIVGVILGVRSRSPREPRPWSFALCFPLSRSLAPAGSGFGPPLAHCRAMGPIPCAPAALALHRLGAVLAPVLIRPSSVFDRRRLY